MSALSYVTKRALVLKRVRRDQLQEDRSRTKRQNDPISENVSPKLIWLTAASDGAKFTANMSGENCPDQVERHEGPGAYRQQQYGDESRHTARLW